MSEMVVCDHSFFSFSMAQVILIPFFFIYSLQVITLCSLRYRAIWGFFTPSAAIVNTSRTISAASGSTIRWCLSSGSLIYPYLGRDGIYSPFIACVAIAERTFFDRSLLYIAFNIFFNAILIPPVTPEQLSLSNPSLTEIILTPNSGRTFSR